MTSSVRSSQGIRGKVMFRWISIFSPRKNKAQLPCQQSAQVNVNQKCTHGCFQVAPRNDKLTSSFIHDQLRLHQDPPVIRPFSPDQIEDQNDRGDRDDAARSCAYARILDRLGKCVETCESRLGRHRGGGVYVCMWTCSLPFYEFIVNSTVTQFVGRRRKTKGKCRMPAGKSNPSESPETPV